MDRKVVIDRRVGRLHPSVTEALLDASRSYNSGGLARFDFRWRIKEVKSDVIELQDLWFLEINCMPTLRTDVNFLKSLKSYLLNRSDPLAEFVMKAGSPDIGALSYLLLQFSLATAKTK
jgi:D-alanine-D-alanine ligase-like ATP-grasp enzyme